jgi:hypothetical protein
LLLFTIQFQDFRIHFIVPIGEAHQMMTIRNTPEVQQSLRSSLLGYENIPPSCRILRCREIWTTDVGEGVTASGLVLNDAEGPGEAGSALDEYCPEAGAG